MKALVFDNYLEQFNKINQYLNLDKIEFELIKFSSGEGKCLIKQETKGEDIIIFSDFSNHLKYKYKHSIREYSSDEYVMELKRVISSLDDCKSISVFLPFIYECRQNSNNRLESKDYLLFIKELKRLNVDRIITFEVHGEEKEVISYSLSSLFKDFDYNVVVSPDKGGVKRSKLYSEVLNCDFTYFSKSRDLNSLIDGSNPINKYLESDYDFTNKKVLIVDDILDSGSTLINAINHINNASKVDVFISYPLFSKGVKEFKKLVKLKKLNTIYISDLIKIDSKLLKNDFIKVLDTSKLVSEVLK